MSNLVRLLITFWIRVGCWTEVCALEVHFYFFHSSNSINMCYSLKRNSAHAEQKFTSISHGAFYVRDTVAEVTCCTSGGQLALHVRNVQVFHV